MSSFLPLISYANFVDGGLKAWCERLSKEGVFQWWDGPVLVVEQVTVPRVKFFSLLFIKLISKLTHL